MLLAAIMTPTPRIRVEILQDGVSKGHVKVLPDSSSLFDILSSELAHLLSLKLHLHLQLSYL